MIIKTNHIFKANRDGVEVEREIETQKTTYAGSEVIFKVASFY